MQIQSTCLHKKIQLIGSLVKTSQESTLFIWLCLSIAILYYGLWFAEGKHGSNAILSICLIDMTAWLVCYLSLLHCLQSSSVLLPLLMAKIRMLSCQVDLELPMAKTAKREQILFDVQTTTTKLNRRFCDRVMF